MSETPQKTDAERIASLERLVEAQGLAISLLSNFFGKQNDLFGAYVDREIGAWMQGAMRSHGANAETIDAASNRHAYIRELLHTPK